MNIGYLILPIAVGLVMGISVFVVQHVNLTGLVVSPNISIPSSEENQNATLNETMECPTSCDDNNPCTIDWCNESSNSICSHVPINGTSDGCWGSPATCSTNSCVSGKCIETIIKNCCGNNICESSEGCNSCARDCGECPIITQTTNKEQPIQTTSEIQSQSSQTNATSTQPINTSNETANTTSNQTALTLNHIIISEIQTGPNEFVELYNPTSADVSITGWHLSYFSSNRNWNDTYRNWALPNSTILRANKFFLISIFNTSGSDWTALTASGSAYSQGQISNNGSVALFTFDPRSKTSEEAKNGRIDAVGWGSPAYVFESSSVIAAETGKSLQRISITSDADNNSQDFELSNTPSPKNSTNQ